MGFAWPRSILSGLGRMILHPFLSATGIRRSFLIHPVLVHPVLIHRLADRTRSVSALAIRAPIIVRLLRVSVSISRELLEAVVVVRSPTSIRIVARPRDVVVPGSVAAPAVPAIITGPVIRRLAKFAEAMIRIVPASRVFRGTIQHLRWSASLSRRHLRRTIRCAGGFRCDDLPSPEFRGPSGCRDPRAATIFGREQFAIPACRALMFSLCRQRTLVPL